MSQHDLTHCPRCGERVTAFAAGCSYCGAELDIARFRRRRAGGGSASGPAAISNPVDAVRGWVRRATRR
jgi:DNA-directed RNA polymerase subunit RPC12/RpoP